jgi:hypothetical protein
MEWDFIIDILPWVVGGIIVVPFLLLPILIRFTMKQSADPYIKTFDPAHPKLPSDVKEHFRIVTRALEREGFEVVAGLALPRQMPNVKAVMLAFVHWENKDMAISPVMYAETAGEPLKAAYVEIVSRYRDDTMVQTNNAQVLSAFNPPEDSTTTQFPSVKNAGRLYGLHLGMCEKHDSNAKKYLRFQEEFDGDPVEYLRFAMLEELDGQVEEGTMYLSKSEKVYRPTWAGAFKFVWQELPPWVWIRKARRKSKAQRLIDEIEGEDEDED